MYNLIHRLYSRNKATNLRPLRQHVRLQILLRAVLHNGRAVSPSLDLEFYAPNACGQLRETRNGDRKPRAIVMIHLYELAELCCESDQLLCGASYIAHYAVSAGVGNCVQFERSTSMFSRKSISSNDLRTHDCVLKSDHPATLWLA